MSPRSRLLAIAAVALLAASSVACVSSSWGRRGYYGRSIYDPYPRARAYPSAYYYVPYGVYHDHRYDGRRRHESRWERHRERELEHLKRDQRHELRALKREQKVERRALRDAGEWDRDDRQRQRREIQTRKRAFKQERRELRHDWRGRRRH